MIGVFDSGEGGLSVLKEITRLLPQEKYIYYSDNANCPYGDKTPEFIRERAKSITNCLLENGAGIIVVACNTATAAAIATLRSEYANISFIGMEPAVKPAALGTATGVVGVLATAGTLKGSKYLKTKESVDEHVNVVEHVGKGFVELVEAGKLSGPDVEEVVKDSLDPLLAAGADIVVLGCTHYPFLVNVMEKVAGDGVRFIDPAPAVARQLVHVMVENGMLSKKDGDEALIRSSCDIPSSPDVKLISSGDPAPLARLYEMIYK